MGWKSKRQRRAEAEKATRDAARYLADPPKARQEGLGTCKLCLTKNGHTADCSRIS